MKKNKIIFWTLTGLMAGLMTMSASMYFTMAPQITSGFKTLGYPVYFIYLLGTAKILAAIGLLQPFSPRLREWAYAGLTFTLLGAAISHMATATPFIGPLIFLGILALSWVFNNKLKKATA
ncbi:DoxX family protein [Nemorincola caseinilytica]